MNIGFIGTGTMGMGMASNIIKAGYPLTVHNRHKESAKALIDAGALWESTPEALAAVNDIVFTCLPGPKEVELVALGKNGIIQGISSGGVYIDLTSNSPSLVRRIYDLFKKKDAHVLDAPVSGGPTMARTGKLSVMVGGDEDVFQQCKPVLDLIGDKVRYTGSIGSGSICKLMHNCLGYGFQTLIAECFTLGVKAGLDPKILWRALLDGGIGSGLFLKEILPDTYFRGHFDPPRFKLKLAFKDVSLATELGREFNVPMAGAEIAFQELMTAMNRGWGEKDSRVSMLLQEERAGNVEVRIDDTAII
jgi:3-hydroxyisobutyrate dehydrogenase-like beta-hydroxyacid dehydrogenase